MKKAKTQHTGRGVKPVKEEAKAVKKPDYVSSMRAAHLQTGISMEVLKAAKDLGCPAFRGPRVYIKELVAWIEKNRAKIDEALKVEDGQGRGGEGNFKSEREARIIRKMDFDYEREAGLYVLKRVVEEEWAGCIEAMQAIMARTLDPATYNSLVKEIQREIRLRGVVPGVGEKEGKAQANETAIPPQIEEGGN